MTAKPEYGTVEYALAHIGEWWDVFGGMRYKLMDVDGYTLYLRKECGTVHTIPMSTWFIEGARPESDPATKKRKVEVPEMWQVLSPSLEVVGTFLEKPAAEHWVKYSAVYIPGYIIRHIPAETIEVEDV